MRTAVGRELPHEEVGRSWAAARGPAQGLHVDTAACGRTSRAVRDRVADHLALEAGVGGYVAEAAVTEELRGARDLLGALLGFDGDDLAFVESGSAALAQLLASWPVETGDRVWVLPSEWGPNLAAFGDRGLRVELLAADGQGRLDVEALRRRLAADRPAMVHLTAAAAHRALVQPVAEAVAVCEPAEVPVVVDTAQALGQIDLPTTGCAAVYGTGRKYLCGPRGVGYLGVRDPWQARLIPRAPALAVGAWPGEQRPVRRLESREASVAGRAGLATALREYHGLGPALIRERLHAVGSALRSALAGLPGWRLRDPLDAPGAIVSLEPRERGHDVGRTRAGLLHHGVVSTVAGTERAPHDMTRPVLRFSPHVDITVDDIHRLAALLAGLGA
ncbi:aminotransferase class V-fold PLP-dependent enzyme [Streptosporangium sp. NPDC003464]